LIGLITVINSIDQNRLSEAPLVDLF